MRSDPLRVVVAQLGARQHYEIPALLHEHGSLVRMHTDLWNPIPSALMPLISLQPSRGLRRLAGRCRSDIPNHLVTAHHLESSIWNLKHLLARGWAEKYNVHKAWGQDFASTVARHLPKEKFNTFFGFSSASLEALREARNLGALAVLDEIAPTHLEDRIVAEERSRFPGWEAATEQTPPLFLERLEQEWEAADRIVVNSNWSRKALLARGVPDGKIRVVPISYMGTGAENRVKGARGHEPLRVLWLGTLCLRKGVAYALEAARLLENEEVQFTFVGPAQINLSAIDLPRNCRFLGQVPRAELGPIWKSHHIFILPTLSDGFAITQLEALAHGLPIIVTPNCGDVVEDGRSGILIPPRDASSLANAIVYFLQDPLRLAAASTAATSRALAFRPEATWPAFRSALSRDEHPLSHAIEADGA